MPIKSSVSDYFKFSVATKKGTLPGGFGDLMNELLGAKVKLRSICSFVSGQRTKVFCVPEDSTVFLALAKKRKLRVSRKSAVVIYTGGSFPVLASVNKEAIAGEILPCCLFSSTGEALVFRGHD